MAVKIYLDDDQGYLAWLRANPTGWVINSNRRPGPSYVVLHRASCPTVSGTPTNGRAWTKDYSKTCGTEGELTAWAVQQVGAEPHRCGRCG